MKRLIIAIFSFISGTFSGWFEEVADGIENRNAKTVITNSLLICIWGLVLILIIALLGLLILRNITIVIIGAFLAAALYSAVAKLAHGDNTRVLSTPAQPTTEEYISVMEYVRVAAKRVGPALGLNNIFEETDIRAARDERILQHGSYWRFKYRLPKRDAAARINSDLASRVLQREIQSVLDAENSLGSTKMVYNGIFESVIQVDQVVDGDAYIYVYCTLASDAYFDQKQKKQIINAADSTDEDF